YSYEDMHEIVDAALDKFGLLKYRLQSPHYLSGGEKQRLALAAVMAMQPRYLILDEPTSLLDPRSRREILALVQELHTGGARDITTMLITQFPDEALMADRLLVFDHGRIIMDAPPKAIFADEQALHEIGLEPPLVFKVDKLLAQLDAC
ncbi:energy-coupling factor transporter ATPase, partial [candidate division KSB1 bacterium]